MKRPLLACAVMLTAATAAQAGPNINGITAFPRVFNDFSTSALTFVNSNTNPGTVSIDDRVMVDDAMGGNFANRHDALLSSDGGATAKLFNIDASFNFQTTFTLTDGVNAPRKETGIIITGNPTGDAHFIVNSDAGEIVAFGGGIPFTLFGSNGNGNGYTPGLPITMGVKMRGGGDGIGGAFTTVELFINRGLGLETTGPLPWGNNERGPVDYTVGVYLQGTPANAADFMNLNALLTYTNVPEPAAVALAVMGLVGLGALRRKNA